MCAVVKTSLHLSPTGWPLRDQTRPALCRCTLLSGRDSELTATALRWHPAVDKAERIVCHWDKCDWTPVPLYLLGSSFQKQFFEAVLLLGRGEDMRLKAADCPGDWAHWGEALERQQPGPGSCRSMWRGRRVHPGSPAGGPLISHPCKSHAWSWAAKVQWNPRAHQPTTVDVLLFWSFTFSSVFSPWSYDSPRVVSVFLCKWNESEPK